MGLKQAYTKTVRGAGRTIEATNRGFARANSSLRILIATVPLAAAGVGAVNFASRVTKGVDVLPFDSSNFVGEFTKGGNEQAVSMLENSNVLAQIGGVGIGAASTAAELAETASHAGEALGGEAGGMVADAVMVAAGAAATIKITNAGLDKWPSPRQAN